MPALLVLVVLYRVSVLAVQVARAVAWSPSFVVAWQSLTHSLLGLTSPLPLGQNQAFSESWCLKFPRFSEERHIEPLVNLRQGWELQTPPFRECLVLTQRKKIGRAHVCTPVTQ